MKGSIPISKVYYRQIYYSVFMRNIRITFIHQHHVMCPKFQTLVP
jgi:hypothetical protein